MLGPVNDARRSFTRFSGSPVQFRVGGGMKRDREKTFWSLWIATFGLTAGWTLLAYAVGMMAFAVVDEGFHSIGIVASSAVSGLLWTPVAYFFTAWAIVPLVSTIITAFRYFRSRSGTGKSRQA